MVNYDDADDVGGLMTMLLRSCVLRPAIAPGVSREASGPTLFRFQRSIAPNVDREYPKVAAGKLQTPLGASIVAFGHGRGIEPTPTLTLERRTTGNEVVYCVAPGPVREWSSRDIQEPFQA